MKSATLLGIIGGTGIYDMTLLQNVKLETTPTPYGEVTYRIGDYAGKTVVFIARHGQSHSIPPHLINYRANIWALKKLGVNRIIATTAVGSMNALMKPGSFVLPDQFLDFTYGRPHTFFEGGSAGVVHVDMSEPYCSSLRLQLVELSRELKLPVVSGGCYVCTQGPRFESPAEIRMFGQLGGDIVGMTGMPELVLAREAEMCYATVSMVTNFGAGISKEPLTHKEVFDTMKQNIHHFRALVARSIEKLDAQEDCNCHHALREFGGFKL